MAMITGQPFSGIEIFAGFGVDTNVITVITKDGAEELPLQSKEAAANAILNIAVNLK